MLEGRERPPRVLGEVLSATAAGPDGVEEEVAAGPDEAAEEEEAEEEEAALESSRLSLAREGAGTAE